MAKKQAPKAVRLLEHVQSPFIAQRMARCLGKATPLQCDVFRASAPDFANRRDIISGVGARRAGARYTPKEAFRAVYGRLDLATATAEALGANRDLGIPDAEAMPLTFVGVRVDVERILDLTARTVRHTLGISRQRLLQPWRPDQHAGREALTQTIGRLARAMGLQGILFPSARVSIGRNLVLFPDNLRAGQMKLINQHQQPAGRRQK